MISLQEASFKNAIVPADINGTTATCNAIDTNGPTGWNHYNYLTILFILGNIAGDMTALKLQQCDTSGGSYADVTGGDFSTASNLPTGAGGDNKIWLWQVGLFSGNYKRFFKVVATAAASATLANCLAILSRANTPPADVTEQNVAARLVI